MAAEIEQELLQRAREGDKNAFADLLRYLEPDARRYIWHVLGYTESEDVIVQDVSMAIFLNLEKLDAPGKLKPFLFRVIRNRCYDLLRYQGRRKVTSLTVDIPSEGPSPEENTHNLLLYRQVKDAISRLPEPQRQVLILYAEEDFSYEEIADALSINIETVKSRLNQARKSVKQMIKNPDLFLK